MTINNKFYFDNTVRSLARVLAQIKPTPWEKVSVSLIITTNVLHFWQIDKIDFTPDILDLILMQM